MFVDAQLSVGVSGFEIWLVSEVWTGSAVWTGSVSWWLSSKSGVSAEQTAAMSVAAAQPLVDSALRPHSSMSTRQQHTGSQPDFCLSITWSASFHLPYRSHVIERIYIHEAEPADRGHKKNKKKSDSHDRASF